MFVSKIVDQPNQYNSFYVGHVICSQPWRKEEGDLALGR